MRWPLGFYLFLPCAIDLIPSVTLGVTVLKLKLISGKRKTTFSWRP